MKKYFIVLATCLMALSGCNTLSGQPEIKQAAINPPELKPGDSAVITVNVQDKQKLVNRLEGVVVEDPRITFKLKDDGQDPDAKAGDGIWSMAVDVPFQAAPGQYVLEITGYSGEGSPISIRNKEGMVAPMQVTVPIRINAQN